MWAAVGRPYKWLVGDVLPFERLDVGGIRLRLGAVHCRHTIISCIAGIRRANAYIQGVAAVPDGPGEDVGWS